jgi:hypothetical protein
MQHLHEIHPSVGRSNTLHHLASCFYGDVLVAHTANLDIESLYTESLNLILNNLQIQLIANPAGRRAD